MRNGGLRFTGARVEFKENKDGFERVRVGFAGTGWGVTFRPCGVLEGELAEGVGAALAHPGGRL